MRRIGKRWHRVVGGGEGLIGVARWTPRVSFVSRGHVPITKSEVLFELHRGVGVAHGQNTNRTGQVILSLVSSNVFNNSAAILLLTSVGLNAIVNPFPFS